MSYDLNKRAELNEKGRAERLAEYRERIAAKDAEIERLRQALRSSAGSKVAGVVEAALEAQRRMARHMESLKRELQIARKALRDITKGESQHRGVRCEADEAQLALQRMRAARRKK